MLDFKIPLINKSLFTAIIPIRIYDINYGNHLGHDSLVSIIHEARLQFLKSKNCNELNADGIGILITKLAVEYVAEAFYGDELFIYIEVGEVTRTTLELIYQVQDKDSAKLVARAYTRMAFYDYGKKKVARVPLVFAQLAT